jgi:hypothetical protein
MSLTAGARSQRWPSATWLCQGQPPDWHRTRSIYASHRPHAHDGAERLEPEGMGQAAQEFIAAVVMDDGLANHGA